MKKTNTQKIIYYKDLLNDDFAGTSIKAKKVDSKFKYVHKNMIWCFFSWIIYYCIAVPIIAIYTKLILNVKIVNKKALKKLKKQTFYLYGNHTSYLDAYIPSLITLPRRNKIVVSSDTVSLKGLKNIVQMLGALPVPDGVDGMRDFIHALDWYYEKKYNIAIYPEAHIWPYYTGVRPFKDSSFYYPIKVNSPIIAFCTTYSKPTGLFKKLKKANITVYVSEPIMPNLDLSTIKERQKDLRDKVYEFMEKTAKEHNSYEYIKYVLSEEKSSSDTIEED